MSEEPIRTLENADPKEADNPVPRVVMGLVVGCVIVAVSYIILQRPIGPPELGDRRDVAALGSMPKATVAANGAEVFVRCQSCHQANGHGLPGVFPPLAGSPFVLGDPALTTQILLHGLTGSVIVAGATYNGTMPAFGDQLSDAELASVLTYIRSHWGNHAAAVSSDFVALARKRSADRKESWQGTEQIAAFLARPAANNPRP